VLFRSWKHGWVPLDAYARGVAARKGLRKVPQLNEGTTLDRVKGQRSIPAVDRIVAKRARENARLKAAGLAKRSVVDGVQFDTYEPGKDTLELAPAQLRPHQFTHEQQVEIASVVNEIRAKFPRSQPITIVGDDDRERFGVTEWDGRRITLSKGIFDPKAIALAGRNFGNHGAIVGPYASNEYAFRRAVITHEMGHALQMQSARVQSQGKSLAEKRVGGFPRWENDTLNQQTVYGLQNEWEWFAEAFADGYLHGDAASPAGKEALALISSAYGGTA
jgi:hypothetical protein